MFAAAALLALSTIATDPTTTTTTTNACASSSQPWSFEISTAPQFFFPLNGYELAVGVKPTKQIRLTAMSFGIEVPSSGLGDNAARGWTRRDLSPITGLVDVFPLDGDWLGGIFGGVAV